MIKCSEITEEARIKKGVSQGCSLSPIIFNIYIEKAINEIKEKIKGSLESKKMLRFAEDIAIFAEKKEDITKVLASMEKCMKK